MKFNLIKPLSFTMAHPVTPVFGNLGLILRLRLVYVPFHTAELVMVEVLGILVVLFLVLTPTSLRY